MVRYSFTVWLIHYLLPALRPGKPGAYSGASPPGISLRRTMLSAECQQPSRNAAGKPLDEVKNGLV